MRIQAEQHQGSKERLYCGDLGRVIPGEPRRVEVWGPRQSSSRKARTGRSVGTKMGQLQCVWGARKGRSGKTQAEQHQEPRRWKCGDPGRAAPGVSGEVEVK